MVRAGQVQPSGSSALSRQEAPPHHASHRDLQGLTIELTGSYSVEKMLALFACIPACSTPKTVSWLLLMPIAAIAIPLLIELIPLDDPLHGWRTNSTFFLRTAVRAMLISFIIDTQCDLYIPEQKQPLVSLMVMNCVQGAMMSGIYAAIVAATGVFPVPFLAAAAAPIYAGLCWGVRMLFIRMSLPVETNPFRINRIKKRLPQVMRLISFGLGLVYVYNAFATGFSQVPERYHVAMMALLHLIKIVATRRQWTISRIGEDHDVNGLHVTEDLAIAHVASGARLFHSLFATTCLLRSKTSLTLVSIVLLSIVQDIFTARVLMDREKRLARAMEALASVTKNCPGTHHIRFGETLQCIAERVLSRVENSRSLETEVRGIQPRDRSFYLFRVQVEANAPHHASCSHVVGNRPVIPEEMTFLLSAARLLHCREAVLLRLYMEIFVPIVFFVYVALVQYSPNISYLPALQDRDLSSLTNRVAVSVAVKLVAMTFIVHRHCHESGGLKQLVFALSSMRTIVLTNCILNVVCVFDFPLLHNGHDFSFKFAWLQKLS